MNFEISLLKAQKGFDAIWVIVNGLTNAAHFLPIYISYPFDKLVQLYIEIVILHGIPMAIVSDRDP